MPGFGHIGEFAIGFIETGAGSPLTFEPVSRITSGGTFQMPANVPVLESGVNWDDGTIILWDDGTPIVWGD